jgi:hypothetical protein
MRRDTRFARPERSEIESRLPGGTLKDAGALGVWNLILQSDDPSEVARWYRSYRDSPHCQVPQKDLRAMRDTMITCMREANREDPNPRKEKKLGVHYDGYNNGFVKTRKGS